MLIVIETHLVYAAPAPCDVLLQIEAAEGDDQSCHAVEFAGVSLGDTRVVDGEERIGHRRWMHVAGELDLRYRAEMRVRRPAVVLKDLAQTPLPLIPSDVTRYLMPSRYCYPEDFAAFVADRFHRLSGGPLVHAMSDWVMDHITYDVAASDGATTATDSFQKRAGVCRDYAHVLIAMARAAGIPARYVSAYGPDVAPMDIHAVVEVFLDGRWFLVDPTGMAKAPDIVRIGVGRDAADVSFMTSFGRVELNKQTVHVSRVAQ